MNIRAIKTKESEAAYQNLKSMIKKTKFELNFEPSKEITAKREYMQSNAFWDKTNIAKHDEFIKNLNK